MLKLIKVQVKLKWQSWLLFYHFCTLFVIFLPCHKCQALTPLHFCPKILPGSLFHSGTHTLHDGAVVGSTLCCPTQMEGCTETSSLSSASSSPRFSSSIRAFNLPQSPVIDHRHRGDGYWFMELALSLNFSSTPWDAETLCLGPITHLNFNLQVMEWLPLQSTHPLSWTPALAVLEI